MQISVPSRLNLRQSHALFQLVANTRSFMGRTVSLDCARLEYIDPLGLCVLQHWFEDLRDSGVTVDLRNLPHFMEIWLREMNLFHDLPNVKCDFRPSKYTESPRAGDFIELRTVSRLQDCDQIADDISNAITQSVNSISWEPNPEGMHESEGVIVTQELAYVFSELINNALTHGRTRGWDGSTAKVAAQYFHNLKRLGIAIVDNGCGLLETLSGHPDMEVPVTDKKAIRLALRPYTSCNRDNGIRDSANQGLGLTMSTRMVLATGGRIGVFTGHEQFKQRGEEIIAGPIEKWQGTAVYLEFDRQKITELNHANIARSMPKYQEVADIQFG